MYHYKRKDLRSAFIDACEVFYFGLDTKRDR